VYLKSPKLTDRLRNSVGSTATEKAGRPNVILRQRGTVGSHQCLFFTLLQLLSQFLTVFHTHTLIVIKHSYYLLVKFYRSLIALTLHDIFLAIFSYPLNSCFD